MKLLKISLLYILFFMMSCSSKKTSSSSTTVSKDNEFTEQFNNIELPVSLADTALDKSIGKEKPLKITGKKYYPDSLIQTYFEKGEKVVFYPIGKVQNEDQEIYVLLKGISGIKKAAFILCYDNMLNYKDGALICKTDADNKTTYRAMLTKNFDIKILKSTLVPDGEPELTESYLAYNNAGFLGEVVTNISDEDMDLTNPIDTLPQTKKFTGDYFLDKKNFVSLRDSKDSGELVFFYHFEKDKQDCSGEIKDKVLLTGTNTATYLHDGDPCVMNISFVGNQLILKEDHGCGNKRPLDCTLDGSFTKRSAKQAPKKQDKNANPAKQVPGTKPTTNSKTPVTPGVKPPASKPTTVKPTNPKPIVPKPAPVKKAPVKQPEIH